MTLRLLLDPSLRPPRRGSRMTYLEELPRRARTRCDSQSDSYYGGDLGSKGSRGDPFVGRSDLIAPRPLISSRPGVRV